MAKILVVEDDKFLITAYQVKLSKSGFEVQIARDGVEALEILKTYHPDIILLDVVMPRKDGFATIAEIKQDPAIKDIPVIIASNLGQKEDLDKAMGLGAAAFIIKSKLSMEALVAKVNEVLSQKAS